MFEQLKLELEKKSEPIRNYNWLKGNPDNLKMFFKEQLEDKSLIPELRADAERRLRELEKLLDEHNE
ncbi:MAG: hypothetical protein WDA59_09200 [Methanofastidiosum sp.]|jgi:hypothetical protein